MVRLEGGSTLEGECILNRGGGGTGYRWGDERVSWFKKLYGSGVKGG
jgi:hypothetical protein